MDYVRLNEIQGRNMVLFKAHAYSISFCQTWSITLHAISSYKKRRSIYSLSKNEWQ